jgi:hypothetical protein
MECIDETRKSYEHFSDDVECGVDREVHATAGREAGATGLPVLQVGDPSALYKQSEINSIPTGKLL